jgi:hypothetical protein
MRNSRLRGLTASIVMVGPLVGLPFAMAGPAAAAISLPNGPQTCSSGQPKLDYEYGYYTAEYGLQDITWSNVCGTGTWDWIYPGGGSYELLEVRMPTSPYHRIWVHQGSSSWCLYSQDTDVSGPSGFYVGNIQVSDNTTPC